MLGAFKDMERREAYEIFKWHGNTDTYDVEGVGDPKANEVPRTPFTTFRLNYTKKSITTSLC